MRKVDLRRDNNGRVVMPGADLQGANLRHESLQGADLRGADLRDARLWSANLRAANLRGSDLRKANLRSAKLNEANLQEADLREADLQWANLREADLQGADFRGALLQHADLAGADPRGAIGIGEFPGTPVPGLAARVLEQITGHPESLGMDYWHSDCGTKHCFAGWAVALAGEAGEAAEGRLGTASAARLLLGGSEPPFDYDEGDRVIPWLEARVAEEESNAES